MADLDRVETNFRLSLISQREQNAAIHEVSDRLGTLSNRVSEMATGMSEMARGMTEMATGISEMAGTMSGVADEGDKTAARLEDSIQVMHSLAQSLVEIRKVLSNHGQRLEDLEDKAS